MGTMIIQGILAILGLVGLYYLYMYLFGTTQAASVALITGKQDASKLPNITIPSANLPPIYTGGEFAVSTWINVKSINAIGSGNPKSIIRIGGSTFDTMRIYLGGQGAQLMVRFDTGATHTLTQTPNIFAASQPFQSAILDEDSGSCDILQIDMQRWIHLVVSVNGKACDVYMDGKLVRSCPLPNYFNIDSTYTAKILDNGGDGQGGFGGAISTTNMYGRALTPDIVYQMYMAGPEPVTSIWTYLLSFFSPSAAY
jgi:hypothetical protein